MPSIHPSRSYFSGNSQLEESTKTFADLLKNLQSLLTECGLKVVAFDGPTPEHFQKLAPGTRQSVLRAASETLESCVQAQFHGNRIIDNKFSMVWWSLKRFGLHFSADLFSHLEPEDIVEVYSRDGRQIFRSFNAFHYITYTLEEIFVYEWWMLFARQSAMTQTLFQMSAALFSGEITGIHYPHVADHEVQEALSKVKRQSVMHYRFASPLFDDQGAIAAVMSVCQIRRPD